MNDLNSLFNPPISGSSDIMEYYASLVPFLGVALGEMHEVALLDCRTRKLTAIANGHISGRTVGAPMTDLACRIIEQRDWEHSDYIAGYSGLSSDGKVLRSSSYYIKYNGELLGMLCINIDISAYTQISELALKLGGIIPDHKHSAEFASEFFVDSISENVNQVLNELYGSNIPAQFTAEDRANILKKLNERKVFLIKGSVHRVARLLGCSEPTIYRGIKNCDAAV